MSGTKASVKIVSRSEIWLRTTSVVATIDEVLEEREQRGGDDRLGLVDLGDDSRDQRAGTGPLKVAQIEGQQVIEDAGAEVTDQPLLHPHGDLGRRIAQHVLEQEARRPGAPRAALPPLPARGPPRAVRSGGER